MDLSLSQMLLAMGVVFAGSLVQGLLGFGMAIVAAPILYIIAPSLVPGTLIFMALLKGLLMVRHHRGSVHLSEMKYAILGRVPGSVLGAYLLAIASPSDMSLFMGGAVLLAVFASLSPLKIRPTKSSLFVAGIVSGVTGTTSSIGGPPIALVMQNETGEKIRASLSVYFVFSSSISAIILLAGGLIGWSDLKHALLLVPAVILGGKLASKVSHRINQKAIRRALLVLCSIAGVSAIASGIR